MKHRFLMLLPALLLLVALSGCACEHEWMPADCLNPQICAKCEEIGDPALGHDWLDATCTAPQTCSRCAVTQGEALAHIYGDWTFGTELMTHTCTVCNYLEEAPLDHVLYVESLLTGVRDLYEVYYEANSVLYQLDDPFEPDGVLSSFEIFSFNPEYHSKIVFSDKHGLEFTYGGLLATEQADLETNGTWESHTFNPDANEYTLLYYYDKNVDPVLLILRVASNGSSQIVFDIPGAATFIYKHSSKPVDALTNGGWVLAGDDKNTVNNGDFRSWLQFYADGTGTLRWGQEVEFDWYLVAFEAGLGYGIKLDYEINDRHTYIMGLYALENTHIGVPTIQLSDKQGDVTAFQQASSEELTVVKNGTDLLVGTWTTQTDNESYNDYLNRPISEEVYGYTVTFTEDGCFTSKNKDGAIMSGHWILDHYAQIEDNVNYYQYKLFPDSPTESFVQCFMDTRPDEYNLYFEQYPDQYKYRINFVREDLQY